MNQNMCVPATISELIEASPYRDRIVQLFNTPELSSTPFDANVYSNCWGTTLYVADQEDEFHHLIPNPEVFRRDFLAVLPGNRPGFVDIGAMHAFLQHFPDVPSPSDHGIVSFWDEHTLVHTAVVLGRIGEHVIVFHQDNLKGPFRAEPLHDVASRFDSQMRFHDLCRKSVRIPITA